MNKAAFIFDLDGVIVDTAKYHFQAWKKLADELGIPFTELDNERFKGVSRRRCLEILLEIGGTSMSEPDFESCLIRKNNDYLTYIETMNEEEILPGVPEVLEYLKSREIPMALGSASKNARVILEKVGLIPYFQAIVDGTQVTAAKPDPDVFLHAANLLNAENEECIVIEDAQAGIEAANRAGMTSIGIGDKEILGQADYVFKSFDEMRLDWLDELLAVKS
ncbi:MAG: beta-phosphoglucomutase [Flavobacteriaceae bacterium]|nr:beta-phosphoglucomutase [Flavobacteriaceae bacterium]